MEALPVKTETIAATTFIQRQHQQIRELFAAVASATPAGRKEAFEPLVRLLAVHETAEEMVIYPVIERSGDEGKAISAARKAEESQAKKALVDLEKLDPSDVEFLSKLQVFQQDVDAHAEAEERHVLPLLDQVTDSEELDDLGTKLQVAEAISPTHPHKLAPESAMGNVLVGPFVAMADRVRDAIRSARD
jgi:hemerythrin superfamily protein